MSNVKVIFIYKDEKIEFTFNNNNLIQNAFSSFVNKINRNIDEFEFFYKGEKITNFDNKTLSEFNNEYSIINISVSEKNEIIEKIINEKSKLKISEHIICPKCKSMSEININNFKISITNCNNNHSMPGLYLNDFM